MHRPDLNIQLNSNEFVRWYWLKEELIAFCRVAKISSSGSKPELTARIAANLAGHTLVAQVRTARKAQMPATFDLDTVITEGWRCSTALGVFFKSHCGSGFRFNAAVRQFVHTEVGRPLADAVACYRSSVATGNAKTEIAPQLEYNRHTREFYAAHPGATRQEVLDAWWARRSRRTD